MTDDRDKSHPVVLVVDDEALLRMHAADILENEGYTVIEAACAEDALGVLEQRDDVELLFTDVQMPGPFDGLDLAREVHKRWPNVLLVVTSGRLKPAADEIPDDGRFVGKPYAADQLLGHVRALMDKH